MPPWADNPMRMVGLTVLTTSSKPIPSISVSVQTEPMMSLNGNGHLAANLANTSSLLANGHLKANGGATSGDRQPYSSGRFKSNWIGCVL